MTELLVKLFVKNYKNTSDKIVRKNYGTMTSIVGIVLNILLFVGKFIVGTFFGVVSVTADAINNLSDAGSSVISLVSFKISAKPADRKHPYGHARIEYVASMIVSFLILVIGFELLKESIAKIITPADIEKSYIIVGVLIASIAVKCWLGFFYGRIAKKIDSQVMKAASADSFSDVLSTSAALVSVLILLIFGLNIDAYIGLLVSLLILYSGIKILNENKNLILGEAPDPEIVETIKKTAYSYPEILGIHDLLVHSYGTGSIIASFHAEVDGKGDFFEAHDVIDNIEKQLLDDFNIACTIHLDPIVTDDEKVNDLKKKVIAEVKGIDERLRIHDFRYVAGSTHTNIIFDVEVPFEVKISDEEIAKAIVSKIKKLDKKYNTVLNIDRV